MNEWNEAIEAAARVAENRAVVGYVPDIGCFKCFERIAATIRSLKRELDPTVRDQERSSLANEDHC